MNMKNITTRAARPLFTIAAVLLLASCTNEADLPAPDLQPGGKQVTITATATQPKTRVAYDDQLEGITGGQVLVTWKEGDTFVVVDIDNSATAHTFTLAAGDGTSTGTFTGTMPEGYIRYAIYPGLGIDFTTQAQTAHASLDHLSPYHCMEGVVTEDEGAYTIDFQCVTALMKFNLTLPTALAEGEILQSLTLSANQDNWVSHLIPIEGGIEFGNSLTLGLNGVTPTNEHKITAYMMLSPYGELITGTTLTITLETNRNRHTFNKMLSKDMYYEPGTAYTATVDTWTDSQPF